MATVEVRRMMAGDPQKVYELIADVNIVAAIRYASRHGVQVAVQPLKRCYDPADVLHTSFPYHLAAAGTEAVDA